MSCPTHALCEDCYAGMVDVGEAKSPPERVVTSVAGIIEPPCCNCGNSATLFLAAEPFRFGARHRHDRTEWQDSAAVENAKAPRGMYRPPVQVVQTDQPQVGQDSHPS